MNENCITISRAKDQNLYYNMMIQTDINKMSIQYSGISDGVLNLSLYIFEMKPSTFI